MRKLTTEERRYCELARDYQATDDPQNAIAIDATMQQLEQENPDTVGILARTYTDEELIERIGGEQ